MLTALGERDALVRDAERRAARAVCRTWKLWGSRVTSDGAFASLRHRRIFYLCGGADQSTAHQSWEFVLHSDRCQISSRSAPRCPELKLLQPFDQNDIWQLITQVVTSPAVSSAALLGGELS